MMSLRCAGKCLMGLLLLFTSATGFAYESSPQFYRCEVGGYARSDFEMRLWPQTNEYSVSANLWERQEQQQFKTAVELRVPMEKCRFFGDKTKFLCRSAAGGMAVIDGQRIEYKTAKVSVWQSTESNADLATRETHPVLYYRNIEISVDGDELSARRVFSTRVAVNLHDNPETAFRESCSIDGQLIQR